MEQLFNHILTAAIAEMPQETEAQRIVARICEEALTPAYLEQYPRELLPSSKTLREADGWSRELKVEVLKASLKGSSKRYRPSGRSRLSAAANGVGTVRMDLLKALVAEFSTPVDEAILKYAAGSYPRNSDWLEKCRLFSASAEDFSLALAELPRKSEADRFIADICEEAVFAALKQKTCPSPNLSQTFNKLAFDREKQIAVAIASQQDFQSFILEIDSGIGELKFEKIPKELLKAYGLLNEPAALRMLIKRMLDDRSFGGEAWQEYGGVEFGEIAGALKAISKEAGLPSELNEPVSQLLERLPARKAFDAKRVEVLRCLLDPELEKLDWPTGEFSDAFITWQDTHDPLRRELWGNIAKVASRSGRQAQPSRKWLADAKDALEPVEPQEFTAGVSHWLEWKKTGGPHDRSLDVLRGLIRMITINKSADLSGPLGRFCQRSFKRAGPRDAELGAVALRALFDLRTDQRAVAELLRLSTLVRHQPGLKSINQLVEAVAEERGLGIGDLEEELLPTYGLGADGKLHAKFGGASATLTLSATGTSTVWTNRSGKKTKSPPAEARREFKEDLASFRQKKKDIERAVKTQASRLERSWLDNRGWPFDSWRANYLKHTLRRPVVSSLIWQIEVDDKFSVVMPEGEKLINSEGLEVEAPDEANVRLWHPLYSTPEEVITWRKRILALGLTQPIKQAHREVYVLTDAEKETGTYSNRFAAHILRNHQFSALCKYGGWSHSVYFDLDYEHEASLALYDLDLEAKFHVVMVEDAIAESSGAPLYVATDRVAFRKRGTYADLELAHVPNIIFSEVMRDVDMFVAVASIANDPSWSDGGHDGSCRAYWHDWAFGELGQSAQVRREIIAHFVPKLSIADKLEIDEKALVVTGKRQRYAIHFGSTNVQILPDNRYLCIVPDRAAPKAAQVRLPFTGDNQVSTILAKAFMLVDEDQITDQTILSQL